MVKKGIRSEQTCVQPKSLGQVRMLFCVDNTDDDNQNLHIDLMVPGHLCRLGFYTALGDPDYKLQVFIQSHLLPQHIGPLLTANICCLATFKRRTEQLPRAEVDV